MHNASTSRFHSPQALDGRYSRRTTKTKHRETATPCWRALGGLRFWEHTPPYNHRYYSRTRWDTAISENAEVVTRGKRRGTLGARGLALSKGPRSGLFLPPRAERRKE